MSKKLIILLFFSLPFIGKATSYTSNSNGNWSSSATWTPAGVPGSGDTVTIANTVTLDASESIKKITINSGKTFTINAGMTLTVYGDFTNNGTYTNTGVKSGLSFNGSANQTISGTATITIKNLTINTAASTDTVKLGRAITVSDSLAITSGTMACQTYTLTGNATGTFTMASGTTLVLGIPSSSTLPGFPNTFTNANISLNPASNVVYQANNTSTGQVVSGTPYYGNLLVTTSSGSMTAVSKAWIKGNLTIGSGITFKNNAVNSDTIKGNLIINSGATYYEYSTVEYLQGNVTNNGTYQGIHTTIFAGSTNQVLSGVNGPINTFFTGLELVPKSITDTTFIEANVKISVTFDNEGTFFVPAAYNDTICMENVNNHGIITALNGVAYILAGQLKDSLFSFYKMTVGSSTTQSANINVASDFTIIAGTYGATSGVYKLNVGGNYVSNGGAVGTTVIMNGSHNQTISGTSSDFGSIQINQSSSSDTVALASAITVWSVTITQGNLDVSPSNYSLTFLHEWSNNANFIARNGTVTFGVPNAYMNLGGTSVTTLNNLTVNSSSSYSLVLSNNVIIKGNLLLTTGGFSLSPSNYSMTLGGNFTNNAAANAFQPYSGLVKLNGSGNQTIGGTYTTGFYDLIQKQASATDTLFLGDSINVNHNLADSAGVFDCQAHKLKGNTIGTFTMASGTNMLLGSPTSSTNVPFPTAYTTAHTTLNAGSTITYQANTGQTVSGTPSSYGNLVVSTGSTATTKTLAANTTINGNLVINANTTLDCEAYQITGTSSKTMTMASGSGLILGATGTATAITFPTNYTSITLNSTSTVTYQANTGQTISTAPSTYGNLVLSTSGNKTPASSPLNVAGNLTINSGATLPEAAGTINLTGNLTNGGSLTFSSGALNIGGNFTNNGTFTYSTSTTTFNGSSGQAIGGTSYPTFYNLTISGTGGETVGLGGNQTVTNTLSITSGTLDATIFNYNLTVGGSFTNSGGTFNPRSATVTMNGSSQTLGGSSLINLNKLTISSGTTTLGGNITTTSDITINSSTTLNGSSHTITTAGNFIDNGTFTAGTSTVYFDNAGHQCIQGSSTSTFKNLTVGALSILGNSASGGANINGLITILPGGLMDCTCP